MNQVPSRSIILGKLIWNLIHSVCRNIDYKFRATWLWFRATWLRARWLSGDLTCLKNISPKKSVDQQWADRRSTNCRQAADYWSTVTIILGKLIWNLIHSVCRNIDYKFRATWLWFRATWLRARWLSGDLTCLKNISPKKSVDQQWADRRSTNCRQAADYWSTVTLITKLQRHSAFCKIPLPWTKGKFEFTTNLRKKVRRELEKYSDFEVVLRV